MMMVFAVAVMMVGVDRQHLLFRAPEQAGKFGMARHAFRFTVTADVTIETDHLMGAGHHQMQVVGDHQHGAVELGRQLADEDGRVPDLKPHTKKPACAGFCIRHSTRLRPW